MEKNVFTFNEILGLSFEYGFVVKVAATPFQQAVLNSNAGSPSMYNNDPLRNSNNWNFTSENAKRYFTNSVFPGLYSVEGKVLGEYKEAKDLTKEQCKQTLVDWVLLNWQQSVNYINECENIKRQFNLKSLNPFTQADTQAAYFVGSNSNSRVGFHFTTPNGMENDFDLFSEETMLACKPENLHGLILQGLINNLENWDECKFYKLFDERLMRTCFGQFSNVSNRLSYDEIKQIRDSVIEDRDYLAHLRDSFIDELKFAKH